MKVLEVIYQNFDSFENSIEVEFLDEDENVFSDKIEYNHLIDFGYVEEELEVFDFNDDTDWEEFIDQNEIDVENLVSFLNEYYTTFPDRIPID
jgi:hypothetical protein